MPKPNKEIKQLLINDFGYEPVELESYTGQLRALKETFNSLQIQNPKDARLRELAIAIKDLRAQREVEKDTTGKLKTTRKRRSDSKSAEQIKEEIDAKDKAIADRKAQKKKDAMNFISPGSAPGAVSPAGDDGGGDMSSALSKISSDVNVIKGIVEAQKKISEDEADDTREAREKKKRGMAENLLEGSKKAFGKVKNVAAKMIKPLEGIFSQIFKFLTLFILGSGLMKLLDWMGDPENKSKIQSIFRFLADWWPAIVGALMAFIPGFPILTGVIALTIGYLPKLIDTIKMLFGFGKDVDKELARNEKDLQKGGEGDLKLDENVGEDPPKQKDDPNAEVDTPAGAGEKPNVQEPPMFNKGGEVPGQGNTDTVPAMLTPGEFVLTKEAVNQVGADTLYGMNAAAGGTSKPKSGKATAPTKRKKMKTSTVGTMMNMGGLNMGGMSNDVQYMSYGGPVQHMFMGGLVKKVSGVIAKTPQARLLKFARNQLRKTGVGAPLSKMASAFPKMQFNFPQTPTGDASAGETRGPAIPAFDVRASGGRAKEQTLGIRR